MLTRKKHFDVNNLSNHLRKTLYVIVQMEPKKQ